MSSKRVQLKVGKTPDPSLATNNMVYLHRSDARALRCRDQEQYLEIGKAIYKFRPHDAVPQGTIALNMLQRNYGQHGLNDLVNVENYVLGKKERHFYLSQVAFTVRPSTEAPITLDVDKVVTTFLSQYFDTFVTNGQSLVLDFSQDVRLVFFTENCAAIDMAAALGQGASQTIPVERGLLMEATQLILRPAPNCSLRFSGSAAAGSSHGNIPLGGAHRGPIAADWSFENMGIGGLDKEFSQIFRRAFASRLFPPAVIAKLGIRHTKGILLYGPPGTGKTLMARQIGKMLGGKVAPKLVMGPEILNKFVGQSEENIRNLFADAEKEYKARKEESDLHVIIFDEIDAICRARGSTTGGTGVADTIVNQLLSKIDGVEPLNNILVIGMTNRKDMIDEALLRPGRLEVHMEIGLPNEEGRCQIFRIHTEKMRQNSMLAADVDLVELAGLAKNYTGAEIEGVVDSAASFALNREVDMDNLSKPMTGEDCIITRADFLRAFSEVPPAFGLDNNEFEGCALNGIIDYGEAFSKLYKQCFGFIKQLQKSARTSIISILLEGAPGSGKTSLAATLAQRSGFPYSKFVSAERMVGMSDQMRMERIRKIFEDCYKSPYSVIVADDVERLLNFAPMGPIYSNQLLQTLFAVFKKQPPTGRKLLIFATTSQSRILASLGIVEVFSHVLHVPNITSPAESCAVLRNLGGWSEEDAVAASKAVKEVPIKKLISVSEMALQNEENVPLVARFLSALESHASGRRTPSSLGDFSLDSFSDGAASSSSS